MKNVSKKLTNILLTLLPPALFLSYHPVISLAVTRTMHLEYSIAGLWLILLFVVSLPHLLDLIKFYGLKRLLIIAVVPLYLLATAIWSKNHLRALLTAGIFGLLVYVALYIIYIIKRNNSLLTLVVKSLIVSAIIASAFCWLQCFLDLAGVPRDYSLLCKGCVSTTFGFPHPNGFAIEPQFMGNLLIAPILLCFYYLSTRQVKKRKLLILATVFLCMTLFITFSRGAIYSTLIGLVIQQILLRRQKHHQKGRFIKATMLVLMSFFLSVCIQGVFAAVGPTSDNFVAGVTKSLHQLSLGKIDLRPESLKQEANNNDKHLAPENEETSGSTPSGQSSDIDSAKDSSFSGYVEESTNIRLNLNELAFKTWLSSPRYVLLGTGLGSAGIAMHNYSPEKIGQKEIVQNQYVSLLLETGLVGIVAIIIVIALAIKRYLKITKEDRLPIIKSKPLFFSVLAGFLLSLFFFSGLPNAIHIYFFIVIIFLVDSSKNHSVIKQKVKNHNHRSH